MSTTISDYTDAAARAEDALGVVRRIILDALRGGIIPDYPTATAIRVDAAIGVDRCSRPEWYAYALVGGPDRQPLAGPEISEHIIEGVTVDRWIELLAQYGGIDDGADVVLPRTKV